MIIRTARDGDALGICRIWNEIIRTTEFTFTAVEKEETVIVKAIAKRPLFLMAEEDDCVLGFATYDQFRGGDGYRETMEHSIMLAPEARRRGVGQRLLAALETHAKQVGVHSLVAGISAGNPGALKFHSQQGYKSVGIVPAAGLKFGKRLDLHLMQKRL